jgi:CSLREA domain-containing protein
MKQNPRNIRIKSPRKALQVLGGVLLLGVGAHLARAQAAQTFVVNSVGDEPDANLTDNACATAEGNCTLRAAIQQANVNVGSTINFFLPGAGPFVISPTSPLPTITASGTTINGYSQGGAAVNTSAQASNATLRITLDGTNAGDDPVGLRATGLRIEAANCTVSGLAINRFGRAVLLNGPGATGNKITGCRIGIDRTGVTAEPNINQAILIVNGAASNIIGGLALGDRNVISGNSFLGVAMNDHDSRYGASGDTNNNSVVNNLIGVDATGTLDRGNGTAGVGIFGGAANNIVGGDTASARNVISGNDFEGVAIGGTNTNGNVVRNNFIGINAAGTGRIDNTRDGVIVFGGASANSIGSVGAGNVIAGNTGRGVHITSGSSQNTVAANFIGTNPAGTSAIANMSDGVIIGGGANNNTIGGLAAGSRNVISGNTLAGVAILDLNTNANKVYGNIIGLNASGNAKVFNAREGVLIGNGAKSNIIGVRDGAGGGGGNVISGNGIHGVRIEGEGTDNNRVQNNIIGLNEASAAALNNNGDGVSIVNGARSNFVGGINQGNLISGNSRSGVAISSVGPSGINTSLTLVQNNFIGTNSAGTAPLPNLGDGVTISAGAQNNVIGGAAAGERNIISGNAQRGVGIGGQNTVLNKVLGNYIGTDVSGAIDLGNGFEGIILGDLASSNEIGGSNLGEGNLISGNSGLNGRTDAGILIYGQNPVGGQNTTGNVVRGNLIGTTASGNAPLGNAGPGVLIVSKALGNSIGGTTAGARNVISGNSFDGVVMFDVDTKSNVVLGNHIGVGLDGTTDVGNGGNGVRLSSGASQNAVGGSGGGRNVIGGNGGNGVRIDGAGTNGNTVGSNFIGTSAAGTATVRNDSHGVVIDGGAQSNIVGGATGSNLISGNAADGVSIGGLNTNANRVQGNLIGTNAAGGASQPNNTGVTISNGAKSNVVGGSGAGEGNTISGNTQDGVVLGNPGTTGNIVRGNRIGTNVGGTARVANGGRGVFIVDSAQSNIIGGLSAGEGNVISGNTGPGVFIISTGSDANEVLGNKIGTNAAGTAAIGNGSVAVGVFGGQGNLISGNTISGNNGNAVTLNGASTIGTRVENNRIGTNTAGTAPLGNTGNGVSIVSGATDSIIGGTGAARNIISDNASGVVLFNLGTTRNKILGNNIGTDVTGEVDLGNRGSGIDIGLQAAGNTIGGAASGAGNLISGNGDAGNPSPGITLFGAGADDNIVQGNRIGTNQAGTGALGNAGLGINLSGGARNIIGGTAEGEGNLISGNANGLGIFNAGTSSNKVQGNLIGTNEAGDAAIPNTSIGILIGVNASGNTIGGAGAGNIISGNGGDGIFLVSAAQSNVVQGNTIGLNKTATASLGNVGDGISLLSGATGNTIGGAAAGEGNIISGNTGAGVVIRDANTTRNSVRSNSIFNNGGLGIDLAIDLAGSGVTDNDAGDGDSGPNNLQNYPVLESATTGSLGRITGALNSTPSSTFRLDFYASTSADPSGFGEGEEYLGFTNLTTDANGNNFFSYSPTTAIGGGKFITATATDANGNTSEFSNAVQVPGPIVTNTNESGTGSLRSAILAANANPGTTIVFDIPGAGPHTIATFQELPSVSAAGTIIDGYTQPGATENTIAALSGGTNAQIKIVISGANLSGSGLRLEGGDATLRGLAFSGFNSSSQGAVIVQSSNNTIEGCFFGTNAAEPPRWELPTCAASSCREFRTCSRRTTSSAARLPPRAT